MEEENDSVPAKENLQLPISRKSGIIVSLHSAFEAVKCESYK